MRDEEDTPLSDEELERARRGEQMIAAAVADTRAPLSLREAIEREREKPARPPAPSWRTHWRRLAAGAGVALAVAVAAVVVAVGSGGDGSREPSLADVNAAARANPTKAAPESLGGTPPVLDANVGALDFPDWEKKFAWRATGARTDDLSGRSVRTVFYRNPKGARLGYSVVDGDVLRERPAGRVAWRGGEGYSVTRSGGRTVVTWTQLGHTCVIVAQSSVPESRLVDLAASRNS